MDPLGIIILLGAVCSLLLVLQKGGTDWRWNSGKVIGLLLTSITLSVVFGVVQWKLGERATVPLRLLKDRTVLTGSLLLALSHASSYVASLQLLTVIADCFGQLVDVRSANSAPRNSTTFPFIFKLSTLPPLSNPACSFSPSLSLKWSLRSLPALS